MSVPAELNEASVGEADDALRALLSSILSGRYKEELYLPHVFELCRDEPESAPSLLGLIDRYYRLRRMPAEQYQKIKSKIEQAMGTRPPDDALGDASPDDGEVDSPETITRELRAVDTPAPPSGPTAARHRARAAPGRTAAPPPRATAPPAAAAAGAPSVARAQAAPPSPSESPPASPTTPAEAPDL